MRRSFVVNPDDMKRINVIAEREGVTPSTVIRGLIVRGIASYESEHGVLAIEGVSEFSYRTRPRWKHATRFPS